MTALRIILAEDAVLLREGLVGILHRFGHHVVEAVGDAQALRDAVARHRPDLVITDVRMPPTFTDEGLHAAQRIRHDHPDITVLVLSQYVEQDAAAELLDHGTGGIGYLLKDRIGDISDFIDAVTRVAGGSTVIDPEVIRQLLRRQRTRSPLQSLSPRERDVLALMAEGRSNAAIARTLTVSEAAVAKHISAIFAKLTLPVTDDDHRRVLAVLQYLRD